MHLVHFGTFDVENYGDLLYPLIARHRLAAAGIDFTFVSPVGGPPVWRECVPTVAPDAVMDADADGVMLGGGNIVHASVAGVDAYRRSGLTALLAYTRLWLNASEVAEARGVPLCWNAPGVPQAMTPRAAEVLRWSASRAAYLSVRDAPSLRNLRHAGVSGEIEVVPDTALEVTGLWSEGDLESAHSELFADAGRDVPERTFAVHLNDRYISGPAQSLAERLDRAAERLGATPVLLALGPCHGDGGVARSVGAKMASEPLVVDRPGDLKQLVAVLAECSAYLGSSLHGMITALAFGNPGLLVARQRGHDGKFSGFLDHFQLGRRLVQGWSDVDARLGEVAKAGPAEAAQVQAEAMPILDAHWAQISEQLLNTKSRPTKRRRSQPPSVDGILEEGIDGLLSLADRERRRATAESARADEAMRRLTETQRAAPVSEPSNREGEFAGRIAELEGELKSRRAEVDAQVAERAAYEQRHTELEAELEAQAAERAMLEQRLASLESAATERELAHERRLGELQTLRAVAEQRLDAANAEIERRTAEVSSLTDVLTQREDTFRAALDAQAEATRTVARLEQELAHAHARYAEAQGVAARLDVVEPQLETARDDLDAARQQLTERDAIVSSLTEALEHQRAEQIEAAERVEAADDEVAEAERARRELEERAGDLDALQRSSVERERALRNRLVLERDNLEERLEATLAALNEARLPPDGSADTEELEAERDRLRAELLTESAARQGLEEHLAALRKEIEERARPVASEAAADEPPPPPVPRPIPVTGDAESTAAVDIVARYDQHCGRSSLRHLSEAERGLPWPLFPPSPEGAWKPRASVIVCVHNALGDVRRCLESVACHLTVDTEVVLVDDGSDSQTTRFLDIVAGSSGRVRLIANDKPPHGYTIAANLGLRAATGDLLVLLNSDTIVTAGWLERLIACAESDPAIGIVGPVSNAASHQSVPKVREAGGWATNPLPEWLTPEGMGVAVAGASEAQRPRVPFLNGYCYAITRRALDAVGFLDEENFAAGYCEENDFSLRARDTGLTGAIADDTFVFHAKSRSFTPEGRDEHAKRNYERFTEKHGAGTIQPLVDRMESDPPVLDLGRRLEPLMRDPAALVREVSERLGGPVRPLFVLPGIADGGSGGSHSIVQEVGVIRRLGVPAVIAIEEGGIERARTTYAKEAELFAAYGGEGDLAELASDANVLVATHSDSVGLVESVLARRPSLVTAYYVQDYEPFFWEEGSESARRALDSYTALDGVCLFAKTHWICNVVAAAHGVAVHKVEPSIDRETFRPPEAPQPREGPLVVAAMVRPRTPRRRPQATVRLLERLAGAFGDGVEVATFGCPQETLDPLTDEPAVRGGHRGLLARHEVAELLRSADVFVDHSVYQAFGRTALEAMACDCVPVVPAIGGASEFAEPGMNALACDTLDEDAVFASVSELVRDADLRERLRSAGRSTAARYSVERAALSEFSLFASRLLLREQAGSAKGVAARAG